MTAETGTRFLVVGGGLAGSLMAIYLGRAGHAVEVYESRPDPRSGGGAGGRSINLALSTRGIHALEQAGPAAKVLERAIPMRGRMIHSPRGELSFQPYGVRRSQAIHSVSRATLNAALVEAATALPNVRIHFGKRCTGADLDHGSVRFRDNATPSTTVAATGVVVGADGAFSAVRQSLQRTDRFDYEQAFLDYGYKELTIPPDAGGFRMEPHALHIWPRGGYMMIALPNDDRSFTCTLFFPFEGRESFAALKSEGNVLRFFEEVFPDAVLLMPDLTGEFFRNPTGSLVTIRCRPWHLRDRAVLIGDACHAVVPFYGQGANAAFEDCVVLRECLDKHAPDWERAFRLYETLRKENTDALAELALANFVEMRDHVASRVFRTGKRLERVLHRLLPFWFLPLYSMVTFSRIPYAEAVRKARRQMLLVKMAGAAILVLLLALALRSLLRG